jgi:hypothetical protein
MASSLARVASLLSDLEALRQDHVEQRWLR